MHAVVARHVSPPDRPAVLEIIGRSSVKTKEMEALFVALGWGGLEGLGAQSKGQRVSLLKWACGALDQLPSGSTKERLRQLALKFPLEFESHGSTLKRVAR
jgi:hypothetical protein